MVKLHHRANGEHFVDQDDENKYPLGFMQVGHGNGWIFPPPYFSTSCAPSLLVKDCVFIREL